MVMDEFAAHARPRSALVIDDTDSVRMVAVRMLEKLGFETSEAHDGKEGLDMLLETPYSICLCDMEMPVMDGIECITALRKWEAQHRPCLHQLVVCVSSCADELQDTLIGAGMDATMQKPINFTDLSAQTQRCIVCNHHEAHGDGMAYSVDSGYCSACCSHSDECFSESSCH